MSTSHRSRSWSPVIRKLIAASRRGDQHARTALKNKGICPSCVTDEVRYEWEYIAAGRRQIRAECAACRRFLHWAPQTPEIMAKAIEEDPSVYL